MNKSLQKSNISYSFFSATFFFVVAWLTLSTISAADVSFCDISSEIDQAEDGKATIEFPGASKNALIRIANIRTGKLAGYMTLTDIVKAEGNCLFLNGLVFKKGNGLESGANKQIKCYRFSVPEDGVLEIARVNIGEEGLIKPKVSSIICLAVINPDGSVAYLLNKAEDGPYVKLRRKTRIKYSSDSLAPFIQKRLKALVLNPSSYRKIVKRETIPYYMRMLTQYRSNEEDAVISFPHPAFAYDPTAGSEDAVIRIKSLFTNKKIPAQVSNISATTFLTSICSATGTSYETTFWGGVILCKKKSLNGVIPKGTLARVLKKGRGAILLQIVDNPGRIVIVPYRLCAPVEVSVE